MSCLKENKEVPSANSLAIEENPFDLSFIKIKNNERPEKTPLVLLQ